MSKGGQIAARARAGFHSIPAVTKPQMERHIKERVLQLCLLTEQGCEVEHEGLRSLVRRNQLQAEALESGTVGQKGLCGPAGSPEKCVPA